MTPFWKIVLIAAAVIALAVAARLGFAVSQVFRDEHFMYGFETITYAKTPLTVAQVEDLMGQPASIEESQSVDQTISGMVYHYPGHGADFKVVFVNGVVFNSEMPSPHST